MSKHTLHVTENDAGQRVDLYLTKHLPDSPSRTFIKKIIEEGLVFVNEQKIKPHYKLHVNDTISAEVDWKPAGRSELKPENIPLNIFYEDDHLAIIHKSSGMVVHPAAGVYEGTLVNALLYHYQNLSDFNQETRPGIVHRLDADTSGVMVIAKNNRTHAMLASQFKKHVVKKRYVALVKGAIEFDEGIVDVPLGRHPTHRDKKSVQFDETAKPSETLYRVIQRNKKMTLVGLYPKTGRTHQLRVHMKYMGHPILGDEKYGQKSSFTRLALHAQSLGFVHPATNKFVEFACCVPKEFKEAMG